MVEDPPHPPPHAVVDGRCDLLPLCSTINALLHPLPLLPLRHHTTFPKRADSRIRHQRRAHPPPPLLHDDRDMRPPSTPSSPRQGAEDLGQAGEGERRPRTQSGPFCRPHLDGFTVPPPNRDHGKGAGWLALGPPQPTARRDKIRIAKLEALLYNKDGPSSGSEATSSAVKDLQSKLDVVTAECLTEKEK
ncbi:hypothetical protein ACJX0J_036818, partial [Zea mays]